MEEILPRALAAYGIRDYTHDLQPGTKEVSTLKVVSGSGDHYVLKLHPHSPENLAMVRSKLAWMQDMSETGLNVPAPIEDVSGRLASSVASGGILPGLMRPLHGRVPGAAWASRRLYDERVCELLSWVPGAPAKGGVFGWRKARVAGCQMAMMHEHAGRYSSAEDFDRPRVGWQEVFGEGSHLWSRGPDVLDEEEMRTLRRAAETVAETTGSLGEGKEVFGPIHGDPTLGNVVFDGPLESPRANFIDFDDCVSGYYLMDVCVFLRSLRTFSQRHVRLASAFLKGYGCIRSIPGDMDEVSRCFETLHHASAIAWELGSSTAVPADRSLFRHHVSRVAALLE